jgi:phosphoglycolate phosphatase
MKNRLQVILFDMDGVLIDTTALVYNTYTEICKYYNIPCPSEEQVLKTMSMSSRRAINYLFGAQAPDINNLFSSTWVKHKNKARPFNGIREALTYLRNENLMLSVVTSRNSDDASTLLISAGLTKYFDDIVTWGYYRSAKPSPACLLIALERLGKGTDCAAYVGDQPVDMEAAKNANCTAIGVTWSYTPEDELITAGADAIVHEPSAIASYI